MPRDWNRTPPSPPFAEILDNDVCTALSSLLPPADLVQGCVANAEP